METNRNYVFTYGTLMSGEGNNHLLQGAGARYCADASTRTAEWTMKDMRAFPGVIPGGDDTISGELYEVDSQTLSRLDRLEGHPSFYRRHRVHLNVWDHEWDEGDWDASHVEAWIYLLPRERYVGHKTIQGGNWRDKVSAS